MKLTDNFPLLRPMLPRKPEMLRMPDVPLRLPPLRKPEYTRRLRPLLLEEMLPPGLLLREDRESTRQDRLLRPHLLRNRDLLLKPELLLRPKPLMKPRLPNMLLLKLTSKPEPRLKLRPMLDTLTTLLEMLLSEEELLMPPDTLLQL